MQRFSKFSDLLDCDSMPLLVDIFGVTKIFKRFDSKRVRNTEFFELGASDVAAFKRRKYQ